MFSTTSKLRFYFAIDLTSCDQSSSAVANVFIDLVLDLLSPALNDLVFFRKVSIKFLVKLTDYDYITGLLVMIYSLSINLLAKGSIFISFEVASFKASSILVSTTTTFIFYSTNLLRWLSFAVFDQRSGRFFSSVFKYFFIIRF